MSLTRGSGAKNASGERMALPRISRRDLPSGLPLLKYSSCAPGAATTLNVGFGMYSLIWPFTVILVRPEMSMYLMTSLYGSSRNFVSASGVSYMWLSASKIG